MSPEQVQGLHVDGRSDQFSLAVIAYEMLTGEKPYTGEHLTTVVYKIVAEEPVAPHRINPGLAGAIEGVLRKAMAKKPDARYKTCQDFIEGLEKAGAATKGWKPLRRGGLLHEPTLTNVGAAPARAAAPPMLPPRRPRRGETTATAAIVKRKSGFLTFLLAILAAAGLLALIGWQAAPWLMPGSQTSGSERRAEAPKVEPPPPGPQPEATPPASNPQASNPQAANPPALTAPATALAPEDIKPSPMGPAPESAKPVEATKRTEAPGGAASRGVRNAAAQDVAITTSPGGATVSLDGNTSVVCTTPCALKAAAGRHTVVVSLPGYEMERREFLMGNGPQELAPLVLRAAAGTLMLTSDPLGASVSVNGKRIDMVTPAQIPLAPGTYLIGIEKDGRQASAQVEVHNGLNYRKLLLVQ
jgi:serine/threonine-protein kinase